MKQQILLGGRAVGLGCAPFTIAEVGINHNGEFERACRMVDAAKAAGADAVKFQTFKAAEFCGDRQQTFTYQSQGVPVTESMLAMFERYEFDRDTWLRLKDYCDTVGMTFLSTPQNVSDLELLLEIGISAVKVGSDDFTNLPLIRHYAQAGLPLILSCGMSDIGDVHRALEAAGWFDGHPVVLLLCTSQYPTPPEDVNVRKITTLRNTFEGLVVGFSDHTQGPLAAALATALGASVFEKHFTLSHGLPGPDHWFSEEPAGLQRWIEAIRAAHVMLGSPTIRPTRAELDMRILARRSVVALRDIPAGEMLSSENIGLRRPGDGLPPSMLEQIIGLTATRPLQAGQRLALGDMQQTVQAGKLP